MSGDIETARRRGLLFDALVENMEGAGAAHVCALYNIPFAEVRGVSNMAGVRDKNDWRFEEGRPKGARGCAQRAAGNDMVKEISLGFSSCPNDTFMFYGLVKSRIPPLPFAVREEIHDIERLNSLVAQGSLDVSKVSIHALVYALDRYALLKTGAALGRGVGPLIVARKGTKLENLSVGRYRFSGQVYHRAAPLGALSEQSGRVPVYAL